MGKNLSEDRRDGETKRFQHPRRDEKLRGSKLLGGAAENHKCLSVKGRKKKNQSQKKREEEGEATTRAGKHVWPSTKDLNVEGLMDKMGEEDVRSA